VKAERWKAAKAAGSRQGERLFLKGPVGESEKSGWPAGSGKTSEIFESLVPLVFEWSKAWNG